jgi:hypothetical protein
VLNLGIFELEPCASAELKPPQIEVGTPYNDLKPQLPFIIDDINQCKVITDRTCVPLEKKILTDSM